MIYVVICYKDSNLSDIAVLSWLHNRTSLIVPNTLVCGFLRIYPNEKAVKKLRMIKKRVADENAAVKHVTGTGTSSRSSPTDTFLLQSRTQAPTTAQRQAANTYPWFSPSLSTLLLVTLQA